MKPETKIKKKVLTNSKFQPFNNEVHFNNKVHPTEFGPGGQSTRDHLEILK